ncbi:hypothetical protein B9Z55_007505 [Caenorhabditis nigoni]|uniref:Uncharacterized protein n=1 Tax=Caenorhabditis nigoni TaxID=1611254 RepID=A0A2G5V9X8_9PELO|nr:hypothetical protein B9Z55_007505 [Caenorhabditis nigoni]
MRSCIMNRFHHRLRLCRLTRRFGRNHKFSIVILNFVKFANEHLFRPHHMNCLISVPGVETIRLSFTAAPALELQLQSSSSRAPAPELQLQSSSSGAPAPELQLQSSSSRAPAPEL